MKVLGFAGAPVLGFRFSGSRVLGFGGSLLLMALLVVQPAMAQATDTAEVWRAFAEQVDVGAVLKVRLRSGQTFEATLVQARPDALLLQPKTRIVVPVQPVAYEEIVSLQREREGGIGAGKAAAIGIASGAGTFFAILLILIASLE